MKSERRHELQTNSLAQAMMSPNGFLRTHGPKVLLTIIVALLVALLLHRRYQSNQAELDTGWSYITMAQRSLFQLSQNAGIVSDPIQRANNQRQIVATIDQTINPLLSSDQRMIAAQAYLVRGDLHWTLANLPAAAPTTQPVAAELTPSQNLDKAQEAYDKIIRVYGDLQDVATNARFGLAAIAENRREFDKAKTVYEAIKNDPNVIPSYKTLAEEHLKILPEIQKRLYIGTPLPPAPVAPAAGATTQPGGGFNLNLTPMPDLPAAK